MSFILAFIDAISSVLHFCVCKSVSIGIIFLLPEKFLCHFLKHNADRQWFLLFNFYLLKKYFFFFIFLKIHRILSRLVSYPIRSLKIALHCLLSYIVSEEKSVAILFCAPLCVMCLFSLSAC